MSDKYTQAQGGKLFWNKIRETMRVLKGDKQQPETPAFVPLELIQDSTWSGGWRWICPHGNESGINASGKLDCGCKLVIATSDAQAALLRRDAEQRLEALSDLESAYHDKSYRTPELLSAAISALRKQVGRE